jgi:outer membrane protein OmpA-like peptidoglycan-associated protein
MREMTRSLIFPYLMLVSLSSVLAAPMAGMDPNTDPLLAAASEAGNVPAAHQPAPPIISPAASTVPDPGPASDDVVLEQGKALYDQGQYTAALDKFMQVLRRDPQQPEARQYLRMVVEKIRYQKNMAMPAAVGGEAQGAARVQGIPRQIPRGMTPAVPVAVSDEEIRQRVRQRQLLALDLAAIPGVKVQTQAKQVQVEIETALLFTDKTGGLREEGIPMLDRVAAWLKTFGQQPVMIHCYPEELEDAKLNGSLFLHRYAQLYGFFVDERKMSASRFINSALSKGEKSKSKEDADASEEPEVAISTQSSKIVIATLGGGAMPAEDPAAMTARWLELSILPSHAEFNPQDGDWTTLDLAVLNRKGVREWSFKIIPALGSAKDKTTPLLALDGKGNMLKRISWDGRNIKTGSFAAPGDYRCKLVATDADGATHVKEVLLKISGPAPKPVVARKPKKAKTIAKQKPAPAVTKVASVPVAVPAKPEAVVPAAPDAAPEAEASADGTHAIWKQVIQFDANESDLKPTLKASLERIGKTMEVYPLQKVRIVGFADTTEANAAGLARQRADRVRNTLINEYQVDARRVIVAGGQVGSASKVEISITN